MDGRRRLRLMAFLLATLVPGVALAVGPSGNHVRPEDVSPADRWRTEVVPDLRAGVLVPVNVVRIYSDEHSADEMAPQAWITTQLDLANELFRFSDEDMARYGGSERAEVIQFKLNHVFDVHEKEVSETLGFELDTEEVYGSAPTSNGMRRVGTDDLRTLKVTDEAEVVTIFCVWAVRDPVHVGNGFGGESNVGFADLHRTGPKRVLTKTTGVRANLGVVVTRREVSWMGNFAHELGHFFSLPHAWDRDENAALGTTDLGDGPQGDVDEQSGLANAMDYENGDGVSQYFTLSQLAVMYRFATKRASSYVRVVRPGEEAPPAVERTATIQKAWLSGVTEKEIVVHVAASVKGCAGREVSIIAWFTDADGQPLRDADGKFALKSGEVACWRVFTPTSGSATYPDIAVPIPAAQLHLGPGSHRLFLRQVVFIAGQVEAQGEEVSFDYTVPDTPKKVADTEPAARFTASRAEAIEHDGKPWLMTWVDWEQDNLVNKEVSVQFRYYLENGKPLRDFDGEYRDIDGLVAVEWKGRSEHPALKGLAKSIPVAQLHLSPGEYDLVVGVVLVAEGRLLATTRTGPVRVRVPETKATTGATIKKVWITYNWHDGREYGLVVHTSLSITGYRGQTIHVCAYFGTEAGETLKDLDGDYADAGGGIVAAKDLVPEYYATACEDLTIYMPYSQLHLAAGEHSLVTRVAVYSKSDLIGSQDAPLPFKLIQK